MTTVTPHKLYNLARMNTATTGTGTITLGSAISGYLTFASAGVQNGETVSYGIQDGANSEAGYGVYSTSGTTLTRTVIVSTNSNSAINLSGAAIVYVTGLADNFNASNIPGTTTNDDAAAGYLSEYISSTVVSGSATGLSSDTAKTVTSISLTAGDWDVNGSVSFVFGSGTTSGNVQASISSTNNTLDTTPGKYAVQSLFGQVAGNFGGANGVPAGPYRISLSGTTTIYLVAQGNFAVSTLAAYGYIGARRVR